MTSTLVIPTVASRGSRLALGWRYPAVALITKVLFERSDHRAIFILQLPCSLLILFCAGLSRILFQIPTFLLFPRQPSPGSNSSSLPPSSPPLWKTPLYWGSNSSICASQTCIFFTRWMFLLCAYWRSRVWSLWPAGFRWILVKMAHTSRVLSHLRKRVLLTYQDACQVCLVLSLMWFLGFFKQYKSIVCLLNFPALVQFYRRKQTVHFYDCWRV